jgi:hypothetical protein
MAVEDILKGNVMVAVALGATALLLPKVFPYLSPPVRDIVSAGLSLVAEAEGEAEIGIVGRLADTALEQVLARLKEPGTPEEREEAAHAVITNFKRRARARARRYGSNDADRHARYHRHLAALEHKLGRASAHHRTQTKEVLDDLSATLKHSEESSHGSA